MNGSDASPTVTPTSVILSKDESQTFTCTPGTSDSHNIAWLHNPSDSVCTMGNCEDNIFEFEVTDEGISTKNAKKKTLFSAPLCFTFLELGMIAVGDGSDTLSVTASSFENGGDYVCVVITDTNIKLATPVTVQIEVYFTTEPQDVSTNYLDTENLNCEAESFPNVVSIQWQEMTGSEFFDVDGETSKELTVATSSLGSFTYRCKASVSFGLTPDIFSETATVTGTTS